MRWLNRRLAQYQITNPNNHSQNKYLHWTKWEQIQYMQQVQWCIGVSYMHTQTCSCGSGQGTTTTGSSCNPNWRTLSTHQGNRTTVDQTEQEIGSSPCGSRATTHFGGAPGCPSQPWRYPGRTKKVESDHILVPNLVVTVESGALPKQGGRGNLEAATFEADTYKPLVSGMSRLTS
jgi:hypothetical protein